MIAGVAVLRAKVWTGWPRWIPLVIGIATFDELTPGMFGGFVIARLAVGMWLFLFSVLGRLCVWRRSVVPFPPPKRAAGFKR